MPDLLRTDRPKPPTVVTVAWGRAVVDDHVNGFWKAGRLLKVVLDQVLNLSDSWNNFENIGAKEYEKKV